MELNDSIYEQIETYLRGEMNEADLLRFKVKLKENPELRKIVDDSNEVYDVLNEDDWKLTEFNPDLQSAKEYLKFYTDEKNRNYLSELKNISINHLNHRKMNTRSILGIAGIAAVLVIGIMLFRNNNAPTDYNALYAEYSALDEIPSFTVRGMTDSVMGLIETQFYSREYADVNSLISENEEDFDAEVKSLVSIYQGISFGERGMYDQAYEVLSKTEISENSFYAQMADWYMAMTFIKGESVPKAREIINEIASNDSHYKQAEAKELLKRL